MHKEEIAITLQSRLKDSPLKEVLVSELPQVFIDLGLGNTPLEDLGFVASLVYYALERDLHKMFYETGFLKDYVEQLLNTTPR